MKAILQNLSHPQSSSIQATYCESFQCQLRGLMFRSSLNLNEGLLLVQQGDSIINAAIHMLGMRFSISVIWINEVGKVVDRCLAKPWRIAYFPSKPAKYILEAHEDRLNEFQIGDEIKIKILDNT